MIPDQVAVDRRRWRKWVYALALIWPLAASAVPFIATVTSVGEPINPQSTSCGSTCTLREAINLAQLVGGALAINFSPNIDGETILLTEFSNPAGCVPCGTQTTQFGPSAFFISGNLTLTIDGVSGLTHGITIARCTDSAACYGGNPVPSFRLFDIETGSSLSIRGLTLRDGLAAGGSSGAGGGALGAGGAIFNQGTLQLYQTTLVANAALGGRGNYYDPDPNSMFYPGPPGTGGGAGVGGNGNFPQGGLPNAGSTVEAGVGGFGGGGNDTNTPGVYTTIYGYGADGGFGGGGGSPWYENMYNGGGKGGFGGGGGGVFGGFSNFFGGAGGTFGGNGETGGDARGGGGAGLGGAIFNDVGSVVIADSTLTGNSATGGAIDGSAAGGAIFNYNGSLTLNYVTLAGNSVSADATNGYAVADGGALYSLGDSITRCGAGSNRCATNAASLNVSRTIAADSIGAANDVVIDSIHGTEAGGSSSNGTGSSNLIRNLLVRNGGSSSVGIVANGNPRLGNLGNYGGLGVALPLAASSPAVDAATCDSGPGGVVVDQRGVARPQGASCDIGAYEYEVGDDFIFASGFEP